MGWWTDRVVPHLAHRALASGTVHKQRVRTCAGLHGRVLEIGFGSGLNTGHYPAAVTSVDAVEPSDVGWRMAAEAIGAAPVPVTRIGLDGARVEAADASYDCVLSTYTLCTIPDVEAALAEARRLLVPGGELHFLEHGLAPDAGVQRWQHRLTPAQKALAGGCHLDRDILALVRAAGLRVEASGTDHLPGVKPVRVLGHVTWGTAVAG